MAKLFNAGGGRVDIGRKPPRFTPQASREKIQEAVIINQQTLEMLAAEAHAQHLARESDIFDSLLAGMFHLR